LESGEVESVELAYTRDTSASGETNPDTESPDPEGVSSPEENGGVTNVLNVVLRVSGFIVLALAIAVLVLFVLSRRSG
jgi:hypothetical protein